MTRLCGPGDIVTISGVFVTVRYTGFKAMMAGLQADTFIEAFSVEKQKTGYGQMMLADDPMSDCFNDQNIIKSLLI
jgi:DNA replication licensing factor MCM7